MYEVTLEVGGALARYFHAGEGPSHANLDTVFARVGCSDADPAPPEVRQMDRARGRQSTNKEQRVNAVFRAAVRGGKGRELCEAILELLRLRSTDFRDEEAGPLRRALERCDFTLTEDGYLEVSGLATVTSHADRPAIEDQLARLRRAQDDPGLMLGTAKEMLESTAKYVLEELGSPPPANSDFSQLVYLARERLRIRPEDVAVSSPETEAVKKILGASGVIAEQVNHLRNREGTGHGRTVPSGVSESVAYLVVREACSVVELMFSTLDTIMAGGR